MAEPSLGELVALAQASGPAAGSLLLAAFGVYGGQFAARFISPFDVYASACCLAAIVIGVILAVIAVSKSALLAWKKP